MLSFITDQLTFEDFWIDEEGCKHYYFQYPADIGFAAFLMLGVFRERSYYENSHGSVTSVCVHVEVSPDAKERVLSVSPTCVGLYTDYADVDWHDISEGTEVIPGTIDTLIAIAETAMLRNKYKKLANLAQKISEEAAAIKTEMALLTMDLEKERNKHEE